MEKLTTEEENIKLKYLLKASKHEISTLNFQLGERDSEIEELNYDIKTLVKSNNQLSNQISGKGGGDFKIIGGKLTKKNSTLEERADSHENHKKEVKLNNDRLIIIMKKNEEIDLLKKEIEKLKS